MTAKPAADPASVQVPWVPVMMAVLRLVGRVEKPDKAGEIRMPPKQAGQDMARVPYQLPFPADALREIVIPKAVPEDERIWVPQAENVRFRRQCST